ncbi:MAG TPA: AAA family ATPase [Candidatus Paceibacterota bacterium]|nr:AAA family ATPase [Candidatus Paceibacterota bacterium]
MTQREALAILTTGANVFLTGEPGSGKTHTVNAYVKWLHERGVEPAITASTGIAATHIGGMTIHAWSGIGVLEQLTPYDLDRIQNNERVNKRVRSAHILIIDEISMLSANTLDMVEEVCRAIRNPERPFGGLQVVFVGDFFQLPPISRESHRAAFAFDADAWKAANPLVCYLSEQHRQEDSALLALLSAIRAEAVTAQHRALLESRQVDGEAVMDGDVHAPVTRLYTHNASVDRMNDAALAAIDGRSERFIMTSKGAAHLVENLKRGCLSPETLVLKEGARVMFTKNDPMNRYANGTLGSVLGFSAVHKYPIVELVTGEEIVAEPVEWKMEDGGRTLATISQVPLRLAWAITVHKSQGMSLDAATVDLSAAFEYGQGYVALSRVRTLDGLSLYGMNDRALLVHPEIAKKDREFRAASAGAEAAFDDMGEDERKKLEKRFVLAIGGTENLALAAKRRAEKSAPKVPTIDATLALVREQMPLGEMADERGVKPETIIDHLEQLREAGRVERSEVLYLADDAPHLDDIQAMFRKKKSKALKTIFAALHGKASYADIRLARLLLD